MRPSTQEPPSRRPPTWAFVLAFALIYLGWGTTYFAIKEGVKTLPPALFGGVRLSLAGLILIAFLAARGEAAVLRGRDLAWTAIGGLILFIGGNGLITVGEKTVPSGVACVLVATTPLWMALIELLWPWGERLSLRGWTGLFLGLGGVLVLLAPKLGHPAEFLGDFGPLLVLGSSLSWAIGTVILRHTRPRGSHIAAAGYQMLIGGSGLVLIGLALGEVNQLTPAAFTPGAVWAFFHLLIVGSLLSFVAYNWLLGQVSAALVGTYAYVNPFVALLIGWLLGGEELTGWILGGMVVILAGVALVRDGGVRAASEPEIGSDEPLSAPTPSPRTAVRGVKCASQ
jgi:drug/metabolite transporter (DMT)-like permease